LSFLCDLLSHEGRNNRPIIAYGRDQTTSGSRFPGDGMMETNAAVFGEMQQAKRVTLPDPWGIKNSAGLSLSASLSFQPFRSYCYLFG
jgi:hypothetical protein